MDQSTLDQLNQLLGNGTSGGKNLLDPSVLIAPLMPYIVGLSIVSILITVLYLLNAINAWRSQRAIIEMRGILREMNERDKARHPSPGSPSQPKQ